MILSVRSFHTPSRAALAGRRAGHSPGRPRLAAPLPARIGGGLRETGGHAEAPVPSPSREPGPRADGSQTTTDRPPVGRSGAGRVVARTCLRRAGPPALRPGQGLRRPGLRPRTPGALGWTYPGNPSRPGGNQTAPAWSRSFVRWGAPPGPGRRGPAERCLREGMPAPVRASPSSWEKSGRRSCKAQVGVPPRTNVVHASEQPIRTGVQVDGGS